MLNTIIMSSVKSVLTANATFCVCPFDIQCVVDHIKSIYDSVGLIGTGEGLADVLAKGISSDNVSKLIGSYNNFLKAVSTYTNAQARSKQLAGEIKGIGTYYGNLLSGVGIEIGEDGTLSVDEDKLKESAENSGDLSSTFGALKDFSNSLLRKSNQVALNPMEYVQRTVVAYKNPGHNFASPYTTSSYSGMMFNFFC